MDSPLGIEFLLPLGDLLLDFAGGGLQAHARGLSHALAIAREVRELAVLRLDGEADQLAGLLLGDPRQVDSVSLSQTSPGRRMGPVRGVLQNLVPGAICDPLDVRHDIHVKLQGSVLPIVSALLALISALVNPGLQDSLPLALISALVDTGLHHPLSLPLGPLLSLLTSALQLPSLLALINALVNPRLHDSLTLLLALVCALVDAGLHHPLSLTLGPLLSLPSTPRALLPPLLALINALVNPGLHDSLIPPLALVFALVDARLHHPLSLTLGPLLSLLSTPRALLLPPLLALLPLALASALVDTGLHHPLTLSLGPLLPLISLLGLLASLLLALPLASIAECSTISRSRVMTSLLLQLLPALLNFLLDFSWGRLYADV
jgi:hypothetical protein